MENSRSWTDLSELEKLRQWPSRSTNSNERDSFETLMEERERTLERLERLRKKGMSSARDAVESTGTYRPVVYAINDTPATDDIDYLFPDVGSLEEKQESFQLINRHLEKSNALGCVFVAQVMWVDDEELEADEAPSEHPDATPAIMTTVSAPGTKRMYIQEFDVSEEGEIEWHEVEGPIEDFTDHRIDAFKMN